MQGILTDGSPRAAALDTTAITEALSQRIGPQKFKIWFQNCARFSLVEGSLRISVANPFLATWLEGHFLKEIRRRFRPSWDRFRRSPSRGRAA